MAKRNEKSGSQRSSSRVVFTGKRVKGSWVMETLLPFARERSHNDASVAGASNERVRTLH